MPNPKLKQKNIQVPKDLLDQFDKHYPMHGAFSWFVTSALDAFLSIQPIPMDAFAQKAGALVRENSGVLTTPHTIEEPEE